MSSIDTKPKPNPADEVICWTPGVHSFKTWILTFVDTGSEGKSHLLRLAPNGQFDFMALALG